MWRRDKSLHSDLRSELRPGRVDLVFCRTGSKKNRQEATQRHRTRLPRRTIQSSVRPFPPGPGDFYFHPEPSLPPQQRLTPLAKFGQGGGREGDERLKAEAAVQTVLLSYTPIRQTRLRQTTLAKF